MKAVPALPIIHGRQEYICVLQPFQNRLAAGHLFRDARHSLAQWAAQLIEEGSLDQEFLDGNRQMRQHLGRHIVHDVAVVTQGICREHDRRLLTQVQSCQTQADRPAADVVGQHSDGPLVERQLHGLDQEPSGFLRREPQISLAQFRDVATCSQRGQRQRRILSGGDEQAQGAGRVQQDVCNEIVNRLIANDLVVVQNQNKVLFDDRQIIEQTCAQSCRGMAGSPCSRQRACCRPPGTASAEP